MRFNIPFSEHFIPKDTLVFSMLCQVMNDPEYWKDPDQFIPERFINSEGKFQGSERLVPFGIGEIIFTAFTQSYYQFFPL